MCKEQGKHFLGDNTNFVTQTFFTISRTNSSFY